MNHAAREESVLQLEWSYSSRKEHTIDEFSCSILGVGCCCRFGAGSVLFRRVVADSTKACPVQKAWTAHVQQLCCPNVFLVRGAVFGDGRRLAAVACVSGRILVGTISSCPGFGTGWAPSE